MSFAALGSTLLGWLKKVPDVVWIVIGVIIFNKWSTNDAYNRGKREAQDKQRTQAIEETSERVEAYHDAYDRVQHLPDAELFDATEADAHNRGIVPRD